MNFNSYVVQNTNLSLTVPLTHTFYTPKRSNKKSKGFTLAEVLITLTVIGVIAAMTVPTLLINHQKQQYVVGLKKAYATISQAMQMVPLEQGCPAGDYECAQYFRTGYDGFTIDGKDFAGDGDGYIGPYLLAKNLKTKAVCLDDDYTECSGTQASHLPVYNRGMILLDNGIAYGFHTDSWFYADVNGAKGPNKLGRDIFEFYITTNATNNVPQGSILPNGSALAANAWTPYIYWRNNNYCTTANIGNWQAGYCAGRVLEEDAMNY